MIALLINVLMSVTVAFAAPQKAPAGKKPEPVAPAAPPAPPPKPVVDMTPNHLGVITTIVPVREMKVGQVYFSQREPFPYENWSVAEKNIFNLFPAFRSEERYIPEGQYAKDPIVFFSKANVLINKPADSIELPALTDIAVANAMQNGLARVTKIQPSEVITYTLPQWNYRNPSNTHWCEASGSLCVHTDFILDARALLAMGMVSKGKDFGLSSESEIKLVQVDSAQADQFRKMTGVETAPTGMAVVTTFWFKHGIEFAKMIIVVQPDPANKARSILTGFSVVAVEGKHWNATSREILLGLRAFVNGKTGWSAGVPIVSQQVFLGLKNILSE